MWSLPLIISFNFTCIYAEYQFQLDLEEGESKLKDSSKELLCQEAKIGAGMIKMVGSFFVCSVSFTWSWTSIVSLFSFLVKAVLVVLVLSR